MAWLCAGAAFDRPAPRAADVPVAWHEVAMSRVLRACEARRPRVAVGEPVPAETNFSSAASGGAIASDTDSQIARV